MSNENENLIDEGLQHLLGDRYQGEYEKPPVTAHEDIPAGPGSEPCCNADVESPLPRMLAAAKWPAFFLTLGAFIAWTGHMELMEEIIAVPGMCVCSACFGWHVHK